MFELYLNCIVYIFIEQNFQIDFLLWLYMVLRYILYDLRGKNSIL